VLRLLCISYKMIAATMIFVRFRERAKHKFGEDRCPSPSPVAMCRLTAVTELQQ